VIEINTAGAVATAGIRIKAQDRKAKLGFK
jgi:hypothetical protein